VVKAIERRNQMKHTFYVRFEKNWYGRAQKILSSNFGGGTWTQINGKAYYTMLVWGGK
jgi:hypothetical protein